MDLFIPSSSGIFIILADFLEPRDLSALSQTARKFRNACINQYIFHPVDDGSGEEALDFSRFYNARSVSYYGQSMEDTEYHFLKLKNLTRITINDAKLYSIEGFETMTNLRILDLRSNEIDDLSPIAKLYNLKVLNIHCNGFTDISLLANLHNLIDLDLSANGKLDLKTIARLTNLQKLHVYFNEQDFVLLRNFVNMRNLNILCYCCADLEFLSGMPDLEILNISAKSYKNSHVLKNLKKLHKIKMYKI